MGKLLWSERHLTLFVVDILCVTVNIGIIIVCKQGCNHMSGNFLFFSIRSFGAGAGNAFRLETAFRGDIIFQTEQVNEIVKLMRAYIAALFRRKQPR